MSEAIGDANDANAHPRPQFLTLPPELRLRIYNYCFEDARAAYSLRDTDEEEAAVVFDPVNTSPHRNVLATSRTCRAEGLGAYRRALSVQLMEGAWYLQDMEKWLPRDVVRHLVELRMSPAGGVSIEDVLDARDVFPKLQVIHVPTLHELVWGGDAFDMEGLWAEVDVQGFLRRVLPGFKLGDRIEGVQVRGIVSLLSVCITCEEGDGCEEVFEMNVFVDYSTCEILCD